jgi:MoaA/NifB/PqqE/SkfB family radical SAM enzyme
VLADGRFFCMSRPLTLVLDVTERCNLRCVMCHFARVERIHFPPFDVVPDDRGNMSAALFERVAGQFFPHARRVALGCAAEPLMHPRFASLLAIAARYGVPELWFPTNLLALTEATAEAIARGRLSTVAVSIDGVCKETYEKIRVGATWERLHAKLRMLRDAQRAARTRAPRLRVIFTWMRSNRSELRDLPAFAESLGAHELDVRFVAPAVGVDLSAEMLSGDDVHAELRAAARDAVRRGLRLAAWPQFEERPRALPARLAWRWWRVRAGLDRVQDLIVGQRAPERMLVIRPSGAIFGCEHAREPLGFAGVPLEVRERGACGSCASRGNVMYASAPVRAG